MLNRPTANYAESSSSGIEWDSSSEPRFRFGLLWAILILPIVVIGVRLSQLQIGLQEGFADAFSITTEVFEEIPARDGRILDSEGIVLADDIQQFDLEIYYPAILETADESWVRSKAFSRLGKSERKDKQRVADEQERVRDELADFWFRLARLTQIEPDNISANRQKVQSRVDRIKAAVERQQQERSQKVATAEQTKSNGQTWSEQVWQRILEKVEERPKHRSGSQPIQEEESYHTVISNVSAEVRDEIEAHHERYPWAQIRIRTKRVYPQGELASHLIGYRKPLTQEQLEQRKTQFPDGDPLDYHVGDSCGIDGLERKYDSLLKGVRGRRKLVKNRRGEIIESEIARDPVHGKDLVLAVNAQIQRRAEALLDEVLTKTIAGAVDPESQRSGFHGVTCAQGGGLIAMDVHTGAIIAAASAPRFDLNDMVSSSKESWDELRSDRRSPLYSRVSRLPLAPGSVFKPITAVAALESGVVSPLVPFYCQGYLDHPGLHRCLPFRHHGVGHGDVTLDDALCRSCNVYFYSAARQMGPQALVNWAKAFGIGRPTGIDLPSESGGNLPTPETGFPNRKGAKWKTNDTLDLSIGQSELEVTPLQIARMMAAIANDGTLVTPRLARSAGQTAQYDAETTAGTIPVAESQRVEGLHPKTLAAIRQGLTKVVHDPHGTAYKTVRMKEVTIAGKTGTAQTAGVDHAWFAGYLPADQPRIAFAVVIQNGGGGGKVAGPVAHDFIKAILELELISRSPSLASDRSTDRQKQ